MHKHAHTRGGSRGMLPQNFFLFFIIRCFEISSEAMFVLKFMFGLDAARIPGHTRQFEGGGY